MSFFLPRHYAKPEKRANTLMDSENDTDVFDFKANDFLLTFNADTRFKNQKEKKQANEKVHIDMYLE